MTQTLVNALFLIVSLVSLSVQMMAIRKLVMWPKVHGSEQVMVHRSMVRTVVCRVVAAGMYVMLGIYTLTAGPNLSVSFGLFTLVQVLWQVNSIADIKLRKQLSKGK
jgi:hypothetical protein